MIGVLHIIDNLFDIIKIIPKFKNLSFKDLFDWFKNNSKSIKFKSEIKKIPCDKYININNYFLLNKIYLTKYDPESLNEENDETKSDDFKTTKFHDKSTETFEFNVTRDIQSSTSQDKSTETNNEKNKTYLEFNKLNKSQVEVARSSDLTIRTIDSFISNTPSQLLADRTVLDRSINIIETPPSLLELLFLEQVRKNNLLQKQT